MNRKIPLPAGNQIPAVHRNQVILFTKSPVTAVCNISLAYKTYWQSGLLFGISSLDFHMRSLLLSFLSYHPIHLLQTKIHRVGNLNYQKRKRKSVIKCQTSYKKNCISLSDLSHKNRNFLIY
jgi:hypothetical protein